MKAQNNQHILKTEIPPFLEANGYPKQQFAATTLHKPYSKSTAYYAKLHLLLSKTPLPLTNNHLQKIAQFLTRQTKSTVHQQMAEYFTSLSTEGALWSIAYVQKPKTVSQNYKLGHTQSIKKIAITVLDLKIVVHSPYFYTSIPKPLRTAKENRTLNN